LVDSAGDNTICSGVRLAAEQQPTNQSFWMQMSIAAAQGTRWEQVKAGKTD